MVNPLPLPPAEPRTFAELFRFYHQYVKVLYSLVQTENALPVEVLFELNAALDHLSRHWVYGQSEARVVSLAYGHLKRSCLDIFKIAVREARQQYDQLRRIDTSAIDNGDFDRGLHALFAEIRAGAIEARRLEGDTRADGVGPIQAFDRWQPVFEACLRLEADFFLHPALDWAKKRFWKRYWRSTLIAALLLFLAGAFGREYSPQIVAFFKHLF
jgi:hypothetical protein